jgi:hypothetical protein
MVRARRGRRPASAAGTRAATALAGPSGWSFGQVSSRHSAFPIYFETVDSVWCNVQLFQGYLGGGECLADLAHHARVPFTPANLAEAAREPGASFLHLVFDGARRVRDAGACAPPRTQQRLAGVLPGLPRCCAARSAEAAHAAASSSDEPPRKPWRGAFVWYCVWHCSRCVSFAARYWYLGMLSVEHACTRACKHEQHDQNCY